MDMTTRRLVLTGMVAGALALATRGRAFAAPTAIEQRPVHDITGSGDVHYLGNPQVSSSVAGAGSVTRAKKA